jgi:hypothetical protein
MSRIDHFVPKMSEKLQNSLSEVPLDQGIPKYRNVTATPQYMVKIDDMTFSTLEDYTDYVECYHLGFQVSRLTNPNVSDQLFTSSRVVLEDPVFVIPNGNHAPILLQKLIRGDVIEEMRVKRLANMGDMNITVEEYVFQSSFLQRFEPKGDTIEVYIRAGTFEIVIYSYDQSAQKTGNTIVKFDARTGQLV